ncbi:TlpA disulfide reductase family protein [Aneurinibacillus terranovensis]|uniref:TlpA disulfide reductase family protein n=1 Tax=Aneurinibacillus terranovensis TaxID=278991 RepID=UPI0003FDFDAA|nr:TlpA disulfide reductase family protein [Aneurinibacillus terranovensis]
MKKYIAIVLLLGLIGWGIYDQANKRRHQEANNTTQNATAAAKIGIEQGNAAPDFTLKTLQGETKKLSDFRGKKVILNMWATWCPPCRAEIPDMEKFYKANKDKGVVILGVNLTQSEKDKKTIPEFIKMFGITYPVLLDEDGKVASTYQADAIPTSYIIDTKGVIQQKVTGPMSYDNMVQMVSSLH